ncbi:MAG: hypothetical protein HC889_12640 [Synechococcaceae cyanobacterium SM1_2_3]|nr:hypothetical protein [Synechococcaceae cyanobacterium SM1_2_3]
MDDVDKVKAYLKSIGDMNEGHGPVVPQWLANDLRKMGIFDGYVVQKYLPAMAEPRLASAT